MFNRNLNSIIKLFSTVFIIIAIAAASLPMQTVLAVQVIDGGGSTSMASKFTPTENAKSWIYYTALSQCISKFRLSGTTDVMLVNISVANNVIDDGDAAEGNWFYQDNYTGVDLGYSFGKSDQRFLDCGKVKYDPITKTSGVGDVSWINDAVKLWGYSSPAEALCEFGASRRKPTSGVACADDTGFFEGTKIEGAWYKDHLDLSAMQTAIKKKVYGNGPVVMTDAAKYKYYLTTYFSGCIGSSNPTPVTDQARKDQAEAESKLYKDTHYVDSSGKAVHNAYIGTKMTTDRISVLSPESGSSDLITCSEMQLKVNSLSSGYSASVIASNAAGNREDEDGGITYQLGSATTSYKSCGSQVTGLGWILCPVVDGLTKLNDEVWNIAEKLLTVNPLEQGDTNNVFNAWKTIRDIANIAFVVVFLITIFSQVTSLGISNYGIKKLLPRLIVCAILVNVSYVLAQIVVDLANIVGSSLYKTIVDASPTVMPTWSGVLGAILGGATVAAVAGIAIFASVGGIGAAIWLLVPVALMGLLGVLAAMLTLAFRQAAIPILVIMSPIAIVARLLPGTEGLFKKWLGLVKPMLLLYPLAALVFGGARFAAGAMNDENNWFSQIIALTILALPLFSLPFLAKSSGAITNAVNGALGKFKDKANSPLKNWGKDRSDANKAAYGAGIAANGPRNIFQRRYQASSYRKMTRKKQAEADNKRFETGWLDTDQGTNATGNLKSAEEDSTRATTDADTAWQNRPDVIALKSASKNSEEINKAIKNEVQEAVEAQVPVVLRMNTKISEDSLKNMTDNIANDMKAASTQRELDRVIAANPFDVTIPLRQHLVDNQENTNVIASQGASADRVIKQEYLNQLAAGGQFAADAAGIDPNGAGRAQEGAITAINKVWEEDVAAAASRQMRENYEKPALLTAMRGTLPDGTRATEEQRNAALKNIIETGHVPTINKAIDYILQHPAVRGSATEEADRDLQKSFAEYIGKSPAKEKIVRGTNISDMKVGQFGAVGRNAQSLGRPPQNVRDLATSTMIEKCPSPEGFTTMDQDELQLWAESVAAGQVGDTVLRTNHAARDIAIANANSALTDTILGPKLTAPQRQWLQQYVDNLRLIP